MTAGRGISHSEVSTDEATVLHGVQLWVALPGGAPRRPAGASPTTSRQVVHGDGWDAQVFLGSMFGSASPVETFSPLLGAEVIIDGGTRLAPDAGPPSSTACSSTSGPVHGQRRRGHAADQLAYVAAR